jgi:glutamate synthase (ferredoxin)
VGDSSHALNAIAPPPQIAVSVPSATRAHAAAQGKVTVAATSVTQAELGASAPPEEHTRVADNEELLKEHGACGVSRSSARRAVPTTPSPAAHPPPPLTCRSRSLLPASPQVGLIASLRNAHSHTIVEQALTALGCMEHRGACSSDDTSGDGAGVMTKVPWALLAPAFPGLDEATCGVGMVFVPDDDAVEAAARALYEAAAAAEGFRVLGWREVPVDEAVVGPVARRVMPRFRQVALASTAGLTGDALERALFVARKAVEKAARAAFDADTAFDFFTCSLSSRTIVYKGMLNSSAVGAFFADLRDPAYVTPFAIYHRRFSTNTSPRWPLAQPFRVLGHNGEINTLQGNLNWVASRQASLRAPVWGGREADLLPLCDPAASDSANLDRVAELLVRSGADPQEALMVLVPEAYRNHPELARAYPDVEAFYEYWEGLQEGWDGPALLVFSDGAEVGARLDRNGLRPARWWRTSDDVVYVASEVGVLGDALSNAANIVAKGRLGPGQTVVADLATGEFREHTEVARAVAARAPYAAWLAAAGARLADLPGAGALLDAPAMGAAEALRLQAAAGYGLEDQQMVIEAMAQTGAEATYCMGDDSPLPVLASAPHLLYDYFKQRFAQVRRCWVLHHNSCADCRCTSR